MPTYEYRCPDGHLFERFAKMSESAAELPCPVCGKLAARQLSGGAGLVFKGSGFYLTDYGKNAHRKGGPEGAGTASESSSGESKSDTGAGTKTGEAKSTDSKTSDAKSPEKASSQSGEKAASTTSSPSSPPKKPDA